MHSSYTKHTASPTQARPYFGSTSTLWTQDHHVTSPMSPPTAYDPTTPPFASSFSPQARQQTRSAVPILPVPQQRWPITATSAVSRPPPPLLAPTPQLAHTDSPRSIPRPAPREHQLQGDLYHAFTRDAYLCSGTAAAKEVAGSLNFDQNYHHRVAVAAAVSASTPVDPKETVKSQPHYYQQHQHYYYPQQPQQNSKRQHHTLSPPTPLPSKRQKPNKNEELHFVDHSTFATLNAAMMEIASRQIPGLPGASSTPTSKSSFKDTTWTFPKKLKKKRRRPSEIFNINFGFGFSSRRRQSSDYSPQVSPRTSISSASGSPRSDMMTESFKRQRIDSTDLDVDAVPFKKSAKKEQEEDVTSTVSRSSMSSTRCEGGEAHPGQLVDFTLSPPSPTCLPSAASTPQVPTLTLSEPEMSPRYNNNTTLPSTEVNLRVSADAYHDYLATTQRRKSFPAGEWAARRVREEFNLLSRFDGAQHSCINEDDEEVDPLDTSATAPAASATIIATPLPPMVNDNSNKCELRRTTSDPSTERFLTHIRASLEARRNSKSGKSSGWQTYPVFADEGEKGFLDDAPL
ncbi:hypothetical protein DDE82_001643 [Stemphylium lycopersici]|uniref:Uncharacterized protein n=1 Tax=Stemphylium lycopersici TaxID=183478 RepID=A0A364NAH2_STELY|nr:hypothetical protein TW65_00054 [Stemphylium lycopersici]RAR09528.1 hypothetical protein DDE82_001643 [Stemphylium lycopersici]RAR14262.1 hypothetical protein DDE83_002374 [Stemphylium lycopersici]